MEKENGSPIDFSLLLLFRVCSPFTHEEPLLIKQARFPISFPPPSLIISAKRGETAGRDDWMYREYSHTEEKGRKYIREREMRKRRREVEKEIAAGSSLLELPLSSEEGNSPPPFPPLFSLSLAQYRRRRRRLPRRKKGKGKRGCPI